MNRLLLVIPVALVVTLRPAGFIALVGQACQWPTDADELLAALLAGAGCCAAARPRAVSGRRAGKSGTGNSHMKAKFPPPDLPTFSKDR